MILKTEELSKYAKLCTTNQQEAERGIREAELYDIIPSIGAALYMQIDEHPEDYHELLEGGVGYNNTGCIGGIEMLHGLKRALAYYAEARICQGNNVQLDRYGANVKSNEYSSNADAKQIADEATYLHTIGDKAMASCVGYIKAHSAEPIYQPYIQRPDDTERANFDDITFLNRD